MDQVKVWVFSSKLKASDPTSTSYIPKSCDVLFVWSIVIKTMGNYENSHLSAQCFFSIRSQISAGSLSSKEYARLHWPKRLFLELHHGPVSVSRLHKALATCLLCIRFDSVYRKDGEHYTLGTFILQSLKGPPSLQFYFLNSGSDHFWKDILSNL